MRISAFVPALLGVAALAVTACGHPTTSAPDPRAAAQVGTRSTDGITPDQALAKATDKARKWQPDARLVGVAWGVAHFELAAVVYHVFQSPKADKLFSVQTKLVSFWQDTKEITDPHFTRPARFLDTLGTYPVDAHTALETAKKYLPSDDQHPISVLVEFKPTRLAPPLWGVKADQLKALIDAQNGKVLVHTTYDFPTLPFTP